MATITRSPTARELVNDIFAHLDDNLTAGGTQNAPTMADALTSSKPNPLSQATGPTKSLLLTLHVLYPNELLPALDLLDRRLLTRLSTIQRVPANSEQVRVDETKSPQTVRKDTGKTELEVNMTNKHTTDDVEASIGTVDNDIEAIDTQQPQAHRSNVSAQDKTMNPPAATTSPPTNQQNRHTERAPLYFVRSAQQPTRANTHTGGRFYDPLALTTHYEVRPASWNCSCPAFAFAAFPVPIPSGEARGRGSRDTESQAEAARNTATLVDAYNASRMAPGDRQPIRAQEAQGAEGIQISAERRLLKGLRTSGGFGGWARLMSVNVEDNPEAASLQLPPVCKHLLACAFVELCPSLTGFIEDRVVSKEEIAGWCAGWGD